MKKRILGLAFGCIFTLTPSAVSAVPLLASFSGGTSVVNSPFTLGWQFTASTAFSVTQLGWYDESGDGLLSPHQMAVWDSLGNLLISGTVAAGTADPIFNGFRYTSALSGTTNLAPGTYTVGGLSQDDIFFFDVSAANTTFAPGFTYLQEQSNLGLALTFPTENHGNDLGYFGPNLQISVPEVDPSCGLIPLTFAFLAVAMVGDRRKKIAPGC